MSEAVGKQNLDIFYLRRVARERIAHRDRRRQLVIPQVEHVSDVLARMLVRGADRAELNLASIAFPD
jgi:hypothetical protein